MAKIDWKDHEAVKAYTRGRYYATLDVSRARYQKNKKKIAAQVKRWTEKNPGYRRAWHLKHYYGLTIENFNGMLASQKGKCALCEKSKPGGRWKQWHVDHDHVTKRIRGLLCNSCNRRVLPFIEKRVDKLLKYLRYMGFQLPEDRYSSPPT